MSEIPRGRCETHDGDAHLLRFVVDLPHAMVRVWAAVATPEGLPQWLCAADPLEPRLGGRVTLRWLNGDTVVSGRVTAWDPEYVAEYTVDPPHGRIRFHLEPGGDGAGAGGGAGGGARGDGGGDGSTVLRFTNEIRGTADVRLDMLAGWHDHFERLGEALAGRPTDWRSWTPERWQHLRDLYARDEAPWPKWVP
ncbi:SRPBCC domain-containing protein [Streptomyces sp. ISL-36]|uniref:SRPBCC domain-containing protein n=1 Tax=Streptomyces sp. ISL-36 TaxID=2819182 RepID=UPI001BE62069|nr:SRPBCC domain-containing protein [Streptomyces sp. ISL-36]MBT2441695.1 SRPBCC domain-containing protein [Streptomyces sp. ISL-36]